MREVTDSLQTAETGRAARDLRLLIPQDPWARVFLQNLRDLFRSSEFRPYPLESAPADFWSDVFVDRRVSWRHFLQSGAYHILALAVIWAGSRFLALQPRPAPQPRFTHADVIYYTPSEYLPPLDTRRLTSAHARKADPEYSAQPIISVPQQASNNSQTIVTPPDIQLARDVALPNVVALLETAPDPRMPIGPAPDVPTSQKSRLAPRMERSVIAPPPLLQAASREPLQAPQPAVIAPPPEVDSGSARRPGDLNVGHSSIIAPAPLLALGEQRALPGRRSSVLRRQSAQVIAPPPSLRSGRTIAGDMIALSLHPAVGGPPNPPAGNRRGNFAATPEGHRGASGAPGTTSGASAGNVSAGNGKSDGTGSVKGGSTSLPSGLYVGKPSAGSSPVAGDPAAKSSSPYAINPKLLANARPPLPSARSMQPESDSNLSEEERGVFGSRKFYSLSLNMPNLNSAGGSWIIRFAAIKSDSSSVNSSRAASSNDPSRGPSSGDLSAPSATRKVDPAYPLELMRQNVGGTVILYGVIHADGTVGGVRVLRGIDDRLDQFASEAIAKWRFQPATKNGLPVDVEATFWIPFRPARTGSSF